MHGKRNFYVLEPKSATKQRQSPKRASPKFRIKSPKRSTVKSLSDNIPMVHIQQGTADAVHYYNQGDNNINDIIRSNKYVIFGRPSCPYCKNAVRLVYEKTGKQALFVNTESRPELTPPRSLANIDTVPKVFIDGRFIGGYQSLAQHFGVF